MKRVDQVRDGSSDPAWRNWQRVRGDLPDINVWLALAQTDHPHHARAQLYWTETISHFNLEETENPQAIPQKLYFCRTSMLGLVRVICQYARAKGRHVSMQQSIQSYQRLMEIEQVAFLQEPWLGVDATLTTLLNVHPKLPLHMSTDVYLAALAQTTSLRLVSFDRDYRRFDALDCLILDDQASPT